MVANWRWLAERSGPAACGAALKADGYGLGGREVMARLARAGCRDFFVATWAEAAALMPLPNNVTVSVLHGVRAEDMTAARSLPARPVLNTPDQVQRWRDVGGPCDVMIDTGINRLGLSPTDFDLLQGLQIETLMSHLACADEDVPQNEVQRTLLIEAAARVPHRRLSLSNSAGICLGADYALDLTRPGIAIYGGVPRAEAAGHLRQVAHPEAEVLQRRLVPAGGRVGYGGTWVADRETPVAILNIGYADGVLRGFSNRGQALAGDRPLPFIGRVSMDLIAVDISTLPDLDGGDWVTIDYDLPRAAAASGLAQYELLTSLGNRFERVWSD